MTIEIITGTEIVSNEKTREFLNQLIAKFPNWRSMLKQEHNIDLPLVTIKDNTNVPPSDIILYIDGVNCWQYELLPNADFKSVAKDIYDKILERINDSGNPQSPLCG